MSKTTYCGECKFFMHEDIYGYGYCDFKHTLDPRYYGDKCNIGYVNHDTLRL